MDEIVIDTLLKVATERKYDIDRYIEFWGGVSGGNTIVTKSHEQSAIYQKCIDQLNELKEFEFPTQEQIDRHFQLYGGITVNTNNQIQGANWMLDVIKSQFNKLKLIK